MEGIWWCEDKHDSSNRHCGDTFLPHWTWSWWVWEGSSLWLLKTWKYQTLDSITRFQWPVMWLNALLSFVSKQTWISNLLPPHPPTLFFRTCYAFWKFWRVWGRITDHYLEECAVWYAPSQTVSSLELDSSWWTVKLNWGLGFHYQWITQTSKMSLYLSQYL